MCPGSCTVCAQPRQYPVHLSLQEGRRRVSAGMRTGWRHPGNRDSERSDNNGTSGQGYDFGKAAASDHGVFRAAAVWQHPAADVQLCGHTGGRPGRFNGCAGGGRPYGQSEFSGTRVHHRSFAGCRHPVFAVFREPGVCAAAKVSHDVLLSEFFDRCTSDRSVHGQCQAAAGVDEHPCGTHGRRLAVHQCDFRRDPDFCQGSCGPWAIRGIR